MNDGPQIWPGRPFPMGATVEAEGTNVAIYSENAEWIDLCLFVDGSEARLRLPERTGHRWHGFVPGMGPGVAYGFRVGGPQGPGHRFDPAKLLLDPYAKAIEGQVRWSDELVVPGRDSAGAVPSSLTVHDTFDWEDDRGPQIPWHETLIYEVHVKGATKLHPSVPDHLRGTYAGLCHPAMLDHLTGLGVTAVELLPIHQHVDDRHLSAKGLTNYWGYQTIGYFAPHSAYSSSSQRCAQVTEFKQMVKSLHAAGVEVILDVVYNHTGEGGADDPPLFLRGIDNKSYYRTAPDDPDTYVDYTGTGNSLNMRDPHVIELIMDSLRYWVQEMHVDGFRFDLAATLARELHDVDRLSAFFDVVQQDPVISRVKLIAEPWDLGEGGYQVGNFPPAWSEWNGLYRDCMRDHWRGHDRGLAEFAYRITGSSDLYQQDARHPSASINFITAHDGFTLRDLVSYDRKHNEANQESDRDGTDDNRSWNHGAEGETSDPAIRSLRMKQMKNLLTTLFVSQGVPMLLGGDEIGRTQGGNNNAYCQDNEISWLDWDLDDEAAELLAFVRELSRLRREQPVLRRRKFFQGREIHGSGVTDIAWLTPEGRLMTDEDWGHRFAKSLQVFLNGDEIPEVDERGKRIRGDSLLILFNAHAEDLRFVLPDGSFGERWQLCVTTDAATPGPHLAARQPMLVPARSVAVLRRDG